MAERPQPEFVNISLAEKKVFRLAFVPLHINVSKRGLLRHIQIGSISTKCAQQGYQNVITEALCGL